MLDDRLHEAMQLLELWQREAIAIAVGVLTLGLLLLLVRLLRPSGPCMLPKVFVAGLDGGKRTLQQARLHFVSNCAGMMIEGYKKTNGGFYYVPSPAGERLMIPTRYIEELKNAPDERADFTGSFLEMFMGKYTTIGSKWHLHPGVVKKDLNASLSEIMPAVEDEIYHAYNTVMPPCQDWTSVPMADTFTEIISRASNRMLGGKPLSRNREWTATSINFTTDTWLAAQRLKQFHPLMHPLVQYWTPEMTKVRYHGAVARRVIVPVMEIRLKEQKLAGEKWQPPLDLLQMLWDGARGNDKTPEFMAYTALAISFAAIRTSSSVPTHLLYDLCARPEYIEPLRNEIESVLAEEGSFTKAAFSKLVKLDSFMKESQRFNPLSFLTFGRLVHRDLPLHDGVVIPAGTLIGVPAHAVAQDPQLFPGSFSGFRFAREQQPRQEASQQPQFVTTNASNLSWGYGKHACSGRFFAANEIKVIMAYFLVCYDFKYRVELKERPKNLDFELQSMADPSIEILIRRRKAAGWRK